MEDAECNIQQCTVPGTSTPEPSTWKIVRFHTSMWTSVSILTHVSWILCTFCPFHKHFHKTMPFLLQLWICTQRLSGSASNLSESNWLHHDMSSNVTMLTWKTFHDIWWHLDGSTRSGTDRHFMTYDDIWWYFMTKHVVYHDISWHVMTNHEMTPSDSERHQATDPLKTMPGYGPHIFCWKNCLYFTHFIGQKLEMTHSCVPVMVYFWWNESVALGKKPPIQYPCTIIHRIWR